MLKKIFAVALAAAMILGLASVAFAASPFPDTEGHEDEETVALLKTLGLVKGDDLGYFNPDDSITRAEFCAMIVRALGLEVSAGYAAYPTQFPDVTAKQSWAYGYINVAVSRGVIKGYPDGTFKPDDPVSQAEALTMVMRALGYKDSLPGRWPLNYIMEGARQGVDLVESGFVPTESATRAFVARMIGGMLTKSFVYEPDKEDYPGEFQPVSGPSFGEKNLGVKPGPSGVVADVDTTNKEITIGSETKKYVADVVVYGKVDKVTSLSGYAVNSWMNTKNEVVFVTTTVADYVVGKVTAVNVSAGTLTVGGVTYDVAGGSDGAGLDAKKNGADLTGSLANKLVALLDTSANIWLNEDGEVYKVEARYLDYTGKVIEKKLTSIDMTGVVYKLKFDGDSTEYALAKDASIFKNNVAATWANLNPDDDCSFTLEDGKIVWLDAWANIVKGVKITAKYHSGTTYQITGVLDDVSTVYVCKDAAVFNAINVGGYYDLNLNRDNKVSAVADVTTTALEIVSTIVGVSVETVSGTTVTTEYKLVLANGSTVTVPVDTIGSGKVFKNTLAANPTAPYATYFVDTFKVDDGVHIVRSAGGAISQVKLYSPTLEGTGNWDTVEGEFTVVFTGGETEAITTVSGAPVTLNGVSKQLSELGGKKVVITWDVATGKAAKVAGYAFKEDVASAVRSISADSEGNYVFIVANGDVVTAPKTAVVIRDGATAKLADIELGDKLFYDALTATYIEATDDTTAPKLSSYAVSYSGGDLTVTLTFDEEVQMPTVWIAGEKYTEPKTGVTYTPSGNVWTIEVTMSDPGATVTLAVTAADYAGNALNTTPGMVSVTHP